MNSEGTLPKNLVFFIWHFLKEYKAIVVLYVFIAMLAGCWGPFNSILIKHMINILSTTTSQNLSLLSWPAALLVINFLVFDNITWRSISYLNYRYQPVIKNRIISEVFRYILCASNQFFHENLAGRLSSQIYTLADNIERILHRISADFIRGFSLLIIAFASTYYVNPVFFYILAIWFLIFASFSIIMSSRFVDLSDIHADTESAISGQLVDNIANVNTIRIFASSQEENSRLQKALLLTQEAFQTRELFLILLHSVQGILIAIMLGFMVYFLIRLYAQKLISVGDFALILGLGMEVAHITWYTMSQVDEFNEAVGKCKQSLNCLIVAQDIKDRPDATHLVINEGQIAFEGVKFHYRGTHPLFENKSVTIQAGQKVGLVGYSGSGKSTFANLILRIYEVSGGRILIDNQDIREVTQDSLRRNIAMIPQDPTLFHRSLMDNIRYGRMEATDKEVIEAAKKAHAHEFIGDLAEGYESLVGERGIKLSGGQRQRIAIARAILKNAPILILDEATSQLDSITESLIQDSLWDLMQNKTTIVIAHRLSTLLHMDRIIVFDKGEIIEDGRHAELLAKNGLYKTLWDAQVGGFLPDNPNNQK